MLFDFKEDKKKLKCLIGIDAEVYILYEDKVLLKSREKKIDEAPLLFIFFPFMDDVPLLWTELLSFQVLSIISIICSRKTTKKTQYFLSRSYSIIWDSSIQNFFPTGYFWHLI